MAIPHSIRLARIACLIAVALWIPAAAALSQETVQEEPPAKPPEIEAIPLEDLQERAEAVSAELEKMLPGDDLQRSLEEIGDELDHLKKDADALVEATTTTLAGPATAVRLQEIEREITPRLQNLKKPDAALDAHLTALGKSLDRIDAMAPVWKKTEEQARRGGASAPSLRRIASTRREIDRVRAELVARRNQVLTLRDRLVDPKTALERALAEVQGAIQGRLSHPLAVTRPPLWKAEFRASFLEELKQGWRQHFGERLRRLAAYARDEANLLGFQIALFVALALGLRALGARATARAEESYDLREPERVFGRPVSMALVISLALTPNLHPLAPPLFKRLVATVFALPIARIVRRLAPPAMDALVLGLLVFFVVDQVRYTVENSPTVARALFLLELLCALGFLLWLLRPRSIDAASAQMLRQPIWRVVGVAMRVAILLFAVAIAAEAVGLGNLSDLLGNGVLRSGYAALLSYGLLKVVQSLVAYTLVVRPLRLLRFVPTHRSSIRRRVERGLGGLAAATWLYATLWVFGIAGSLRAALAGLLGAELTVGALSISLGDVLVFALTVWLSFALARFVNFVLAEDVFTRLRLARGVPYAISSLVRYTLIFFGFMVALAAAGIELGKLTVIAGGLGVGIGFGLQNVVNNFVSGLILLFERPVQVGDVVQLANQNLWGEIRRIGIRASVVHTWDGAEVVVPNGQLISDAVTNWTLSDRHRRVEVNVGVEYGTDAQRVIDLLLEVAGSHPSVLETPPPRAFFLSFGDSALEFVLRGWIANFDDGYQIRSELGVAVQRALGEAGISVPFPQRDLHLRTVSPTAASELGRANPPAPRRIPGDSDR